MPAQSTRSGPMRSAENLNGQRRPVELGNVEPFEILPGVVIALVAEQADSHSLAEL